MKFKSCILVMLIFSSVMFLDACSTKHVDTETESAKTVVENYFIYKNEKNKEKVLSTLTERYNDPNVIWGFENLDSIKLKHIEEEKNPNMKEIYLKSGRGSVNGTTEKNLKVFKVTFDVKYKKDGVGPLDSGRYTWLFHVIRKDKKSSWLIDDYGE